MLTKISLKLEGLDLRDDQVMDAIPEELHAALNFYAKGGLSVAVLVTNAQGTRAGLEAVDYARQISKLMPGAGVEGVYDELVSLAQIAGRCEVATEAVRLWAAGKRRTSLQPFPRVQEIVPQGTNRLVSLYRWSDVLVWVREVLDLDPEVGITYLSAAHVADLNAELAHLERTVPNSPWRIFHKTVVREASVNPSVFLQNSRKGGSMRTSSSKVFVSYNHSSPDVLGDIDGILSSLRGELRSNAGK